MWFVFEGWINYDAEVLDGRAVWNDGVGQNQSIWVVFVPNCEMKAFIVRNI
jgi:hypothetical protein